MSVNRDYLALLRAENEKPPIGTFGTSLPRHIEVETGAPPDSTAAAPVVENRKNMPRTASAKSDKSRLGTFGTSLPRHFQAKNAEPGGDATGALRAAAGPDWPEVRDNPDALAALRAALAVERSRAEGIAPPDYTQAVVCAGCGLVWLWQGAPARVIGCPWCANRINGRPVPRPATPPAAPVVTCGTCEHYLPDSYGAGGLGRCRIDAPGSRVAPALWPRGEHRCAAWEAVP